MAICNAEQKSNLCGFRKGATARVRHFYSEKERKKEKTACPALGSKTQRFISTHSYRDTTTKKAIGVTAVSCIGDRIQCTLFHVSRHTFTTIAFSVA